MKTLTTQIGGKYHKDDQTLFQLKHALQEAKVKVTHPIADAIIYSSNGQGFAFDPKKLTFLEVEEDYYQSIAHTQFHTVNNTFKEQRGYIGESAALEIAYAILHGRPIMLQYIPSLKKGISPIVAEVLQENFQHMNIVNLLTLPLEEIQKTVAAIVKSRPRYQYTDDQKQGILKEVSSLFARIRKV